MDEVDILFGLGGIGEEFIVEVFLGCFGEFLLVCNLCDFMMYWSDSTKGAYYMLGVKMRDCDLCEHPNCILQQRKYNTLLFV